MSVLEQFIKLVPRHLLKGQIVRLGDFGSFLTSTSSMGVDLEENFNDSFIKKTAIRFNPSRVIKNILKNVQYILSNWLNL